MTEGLRPCRSFTQYGAVCYQCPMPEDNQVIKETSMTPVPQYPEPKYNLPAKQRVTYTFPPKKESK